jgi:DNA helicase-2/ATP-dependent DNA helicase PcrA
MISKEKQRVLDGTGHMLIKGGPGSGKTTIALLKAKSIVETGILRDEQSVLFLSFARSTIARVEQHSQTVIDKETRRKIEITTYHSFIWSILRSHGYLLTSKQMRILLPYEASVALSNCSNQEEKENEMNRLFEVDGLIHFDLFAKKCCELLTKSNVLLKIFTYAYPIIILDEFQDTNDDEWNLIKILCKHSDLIALADPDQRIYDFRGADPARIQQFTETTSPEIFNFGIENNRSSGTDIVEYGNDILTGTNLFKKYNDVIVYKYELRKGNVHQLKLKWFLLERIKELSAESHRNWSIAVLVPSNALMVSISDILSKSQRLTSGISIPSIEHDVVIDTAGPALAAILIAQVLEQCSQNKCNLSIIVTNLCEHILGRKGDKQPNQAETELAIALKEYIDKGEFAKPIRGLKRQRIIEECKSIAKLSNELVFSGDVAQDWIAVRNLFKQSAMDCLKQVYNDSLFIKLLKKGTLLNSNLSNTWKENGNYKDATNIVREAFIQEHFATSLKVWRGVNVMTIHKAKGKEFDEVIVFEGAYKGQRFIYSDKKLDEAQRNLRVAVTRAKRKAYIITPKNDPCPLIAQ